ncbi:FTR1 family protein [Iodobacter sp.]|uniref:FTR1 family iron permease n=1 Tax=Iodobacter sp. TaxID=1915058 RepID=UPI0025D60368|nr:FTR1 family protein [Iodobacter sp.]
MEQVAFIVWRESVEALLVVGILYAWLRANPVAGQRGMAYLWGGVGLGLVLSGLLALTLLGVSSWLDDTAQEYFQAAMPLVAAALIVQMVVWMRKNGRSLKRELEGGLASNAAEKNWWGLLFLVALAVAREGSETVVFLYGSVAGSSNGGSLALAGLGGFVAALATFQLLQLGGKYISWRWFFKITEILLLLLAGAMLNSGVEHLIGMGVLPAMIDPLWDSSAWLDESMGVGKLLADFAGYRSHPALSLLVIWSSYWIASTWLLRRVSRTGQ